MIQKASQDKAATMRPLLGIGFVVLATVIFAWQDAITKTLVSEYPVGFILAVRYWAFLLAGFFLMASAQGGVRANIKTRRPVLQCVRSLMLVLDLLMAGFAFRYLGVAEVTALYQAYPLFGTILAALFLNETVGWRRYLGLGVGFIGILIMLRPGAGVLSHGALYALSTSMLFATYIILTRLVSHVDGPQTSFFYAGVVGTVIMTAGMPFFWVNMATADLWLLGLLCLTSISGHFCMIKALSMASVTLIQPFNYLQLVWSVFVGFIVFGDMPDSLTLVGASIVVASGIFVFYRGEIRKPRIKVK